MFHLFHPKESIGGVSVPSEKVQAEAFVYGMEGFATLLTVVATLFFFGYVFIRTLIYWKSPGKISKNVTLFKRSIRLLSLLHVSSLIDSLSIGGIALLFTRVKKIEFFCVLEGFLIEITQWIMTLTALSIGLWVVFEFIMIKKQVFLSERRKRIGEFCNYVFILSIATLAACLPLPWHKYEEVHYWCWLKDVNWQWGLHYVPLWVLILSMVVVFFFSVFLLWRTLKDKFAVMMFMSYVKLDVITHEDGMTVIRDAQSDHSLIDYGGDTINDSSSSSHPYIATQNVNPVKFVSKLILYPLLFVLTWVVPTIRRICNAFGFDSFVLGGFHAFCGSSFGFFAVLLFFVNYPVLRLAVKCILCCGLGKPLLHISKVSTGSVAHDDTQGLLCSRNLELLEDDRDGE